MSQIRDIEIGQENRASHVCEIGGENVANKGIESGNCRNGGI